MGTPKPWELTDEDVDNGVPLPDSTPSPSHEVVDDRFDESGVGDAFELAEVGDDPWDKEDIEDSPAGSESSSDAPEIEDDGAGPSFTEGDVESNSLAASIEDVDESPAAPQNAAPPSANTAGAALDEDDPEDWDTPVLPESSDGDDVGYAFAKVPQQTQANPQVTLSVPVSPSSSGTKANRPRREETPRERQSRLQRSSAAGAAPARTRPAPKDSRREAKLAEAAAKPALFQRLKNSLSKDEQGVDAEREVRRAAIRPVNVTFLGEGSGGKTTLAMALGMAMASSRSDRVLAVDASPYGGPLAIRGPRESHGSVVTLVNQLEYVSSHAHVREHTSQGMTGLEVLGNDKFVNDDDELTGTNYGRLLDQLRRYYNIILSDGPGHMRSASRSLQDALLDETDVLVIVVKGVDGMSTELNLIEMLKKRYPRGHRVRDLLSEAIIVVNSHAPYRNVNVAKMEQFLKTKVSDHVIEVPFDPSLEGGTEIQFDKLKPKTQKAVHEIAAAVTSSPGFTGL